MDEQGAQEQFRLLVQRFQSLHPLKARIAVYEFVRDIAYGNIGSRSAFDVLLARKGTCSGKHALLRMILEALGYEVQSWFARHDFGKFPIKPWPAELAKYQS